MGSGTQRGLDLTSLVLGLAGALALFMGSIVVAADGDALVQDIQKAMSSIQRRIATEPSRAEREWLDVQPKLKQLESDARDHVKLADLKAANDDLREKLVKRLGHEPGAATDEDAGKQSPKDDKPADVAGDSSLPSGVVSGLKQVDAALMGAEKALYGDHVQTATRKLSDARKVMKQIEDRYGQKIPKNDPQMAAAQKHLAEVGDRIAAAERAVAAAAAAEAAAKKRQKDQSQAWIDKLSPFLDHKNDLYLRQGAEFNNASDDEQTLSRKGYAQANKLLEAYRKTEFSDGKTIELRNIETGVISRVMIWNEDQTREQRQAACAEWVGKLGQFVDVGMGSRKYLVTGITMSEDDITKRAALFDEAKAVWAEYQKAEFPLGKTEQLEDLAKELQTRLEQMPEDLRKSRALVSGNLEGELDRVLARLNADTGWRTDIDRTPNLVMARDVDPLRAAVEKYASTVGPDDAKLTTLREKLAEIEKTDQANRKIRAERTYMQPTGYQGDDADHLAAKAKEVVEAASKGASVLRVTLPAADWREESVVEWTDTTHTALRARTTRYMTAQSAAKLPDGRVYLQCVHLAADRTADGAWGPLYGHVMWSDWMAEANVKKTKVDSVPGN